MYLLQNSEMRHSRRATQTMKTTLPELQQPYKENRKETIGEISFDKNNIEKVKKTLYEFWKI